MKKTKGWRRFEDVGKSGFILWFKMENGTALLWQSGRRIGRIAIENLRMILDKMESDCSICQPGILEEMDFSDLSFPKLVCNCCRAHYCVVLGELHLWGNAEEAYARARRYGISISTVRVRRGRRRRVYYEDD